MVLLTSGILNTVISFQTFDISVLPAIGTLRTYLLLEIASVLLVDKDQVKVVSSAELLVHVAERRSELKSSKEQSNGDRFAYEQKMVRCFGSIPASSVHTSYGGSVHYLEFGNGFALVVLVRCRTRRLTTNDRKLHVLNLDSNQQEVNLANDNILEVVPKPALEKTTELKSNHSLGFIVLKLDM